MIEKKRSELIKTVEKKGFNDPETLQVSQELDRMMNENNEKIKKPLK